MGCYMIRTFYVFFRPSGPVPFWLRWMDKKISHCYTVEKQSIGGYDIFLKTEHLLNIIESQAALGAFESIREPGHRVIMIDVDVDPKKNMWHLLPLDCVSITKKLMGINRPLVFTPKKLFRYLLSIGGKEV